TAAGSVTSSSRWPKPTTSWPALPAASIRSRPSMPAAPVTSSFIAPPTLGEFDLGVVPDQEADRPLDALAAGHLHVAAEQAGLQPRPGASDRRAGEDDRVLDLRADDPDLVADRGVGTDVGVLDRGAGADHGRAADDRAGQRRAGFEDDPAFQHRLL